MDYFRKSSRDTLGNLFTGSFEISFAAEMSSAVPQKQSSSYYSINSHRDFFLEIPLSISIDFFKNFYKDFFSEFLLEIP